MDELDLVGFHFNSNGDDVNDGNANLTNPWLVGIFFEVEDGEFYANPGPVN